MPTATEARNMELMQTLDDAWNAQNVEIFRARHKPNVVVRWPGQPDPTVGIEDHTAESIAFWKTFPDLASRKPTVSRILRVRGLDVFDRALSRDHEGTDGDGWPRDSADRQIL